MQVSDPQGKHWLADDPNFIASLDDLDRGLAGGAGSDRGETYGELISQAEPPPALRDDPPVPPPSRPINAARALDPAHVLDTTPQPRRTPAPPKHAPSAAAAPTPSAAASPPPAPPAPPAPPPGPAPPLAFQRPPSAEWSTRRPLLDLFPPSALEPERPPMPMLGTAVGPQLPPPRPRPAPKPAAGAPSPLDALTYETFYGLREKPFSLATDPRFQYQSAAHERASQELLAAIRKHGGPAVLTGPIGMGKTTLCRGLVQEVDRRIVTSLVLDPLQSIDDLLKTMLVDFGVVSREDLAAAPHLARETLLGTLRSFLESLVPIQASAVVFIDEAQNVPVGVLEDFASTLGAGSPAGRVLQLVLVGQPALGTLLKHPDLRGLNASVARRTELEPLRADEVSGYVMHRLSIAGADARIEFDDAAIARLFELSEGSPRVVNLLCDHAMTRGHASAAGVIDVTLIDAAAVDLGIEAPPVDGPGTIGTLLIVLAFACLVLAGAAAAVYVSRDAVSRTILQWEKVPQPPGGPIRRLPVPLAPVPPPAGN